MTETENAPQSVPQSAPQSPEGESKPPARSPPRRGPGIVTIAGHFPEGVRRQLRIIAAQAGRTSQSLLGEALNDLFRKRGQLPTAPE